MTKDQATLVCYIGKHLYHCGVYTDTLIKTHQFHDVSNEALRDFFEAMVKKYAIQRVTFNFAVESLLTVAVPWSSEFILHPNTYIGLFTRPIVPDSHDLEEYYYWYDLPKPSQASYVIATNLTHTRLLQTILNSINPAIKFDYTNEISDTLNRHDYSGKSFNVIIPSINQYLAIATVHPNKHLGFLTTLVYKDGVNTTTLEALKLFLMAKLPDWVETSADFEYKILVSNTMTKPKPVYPATIATKSSIRAIVAGLLALSLLIYFWNVRQQITALTEQKQQLEKHSQQIKRQSVVPHELTNKKLLSLFQSIDTPAFQEIYIQKVSSSNLKDNRTAVLLSGKASSFLALDDYITRLKKDKRVLNVDIISSFEDNATVPTTISFEIRINLANTEGL